MVWRDLIDLSERLRLQIDLETLPIWDTKFLLHTLDNSNGSTHTFSFRESFHNSRFFYFPSFAQIICKFPFNFGNFWTQFSKKIGVDRVKPFCVLKNLIFANLYEICSSTKQQITYLHVWKSLLHLQNCRFIYYNNWNLFSSGL